MRGTGLVAVGVLSALLACKSSEKSESSSTSKEPAPTSTPAATAAPTAPATGEADPAKAAGGSTDFPTDGLKTIADNCSAASVILASVPQKVVDGWKGGQEWNWAVQAMLANPQFTLRDDSTNQSMEVKFLQYQQAGDVAALVAHCQDGVTCNKLAAMYKFVVPGGRPQLFCGSKIPSIQGVGATVVKLTPFGGTDAKIPDNKNVIGQCARLHACSRTLEHSTDDDLGLKCQRGPSKFKLACASKKSCAEVVACTKE
jgi:hypothetical protein